MSGNKNNIVSNDGQIIPHDRLLTKAFLETIREEIGKAVQIVDGEHERNGWIPVRHINEVFDKYVLALREITDPICDNCKERKSKHIQHIDAGTNVFLLCPNHPLFKQNKENSAK